MEKNRPLILISNDDGVSAKGINELIKFIRPLGEIVVMAPDSPRSGMGCAITADRPIKYSLVKREPGLTIYKCSGTPVDCVKLAKGVVLDREPDLVISGINHGDNAAVNVHYSGTMGVVIEGCLNNIPSIGFSLCDHSFDADFEPLCETIRKVATNVLQNGLPKGICLNVNFPVCSQLKGVKICRQTVGRWTNEWEGRVHPRGGNYFWLTGEFENDELNAEDSDHWALNNGYVAITPTKVDVTAYEVMEQLNKWEF